MQLLAEAVDTHDHSAGYGLAVTRIGALTGALTVALSSAGAATTLTQNGAGKALALVGAGNVVQSLSNVQPGGATLTQWTNDQTASLVVGTYGSSEAVNNFGNARGNWAQMMASGASLLGLMLGTATDDPVVIGSNDAEVARFRSGTGLSLRLQGTGQTVAAFDTAGNLGGALKLWDTGSAVGNGGAVVFGAHGTNESYFAAIKGLMTDGTPNGIGDLVVATRKLTADAALTPVARFYASGGVYLGGAGADPGAENVTVKGVISNVSGVGLKNILASNSVIAGNDVANQVSLNGGPALSPVGIQASGASVAIDIVLTPKAGVVQFNYATTTGHTSSANRQLAIKDSVGTTYYIPLNS